MYHSVGGTLHGGPQGATSELFSLPFSAQTPVFGQEQDEAPASPRQLAA